MEEKTGHTVTYKLRKLLTFSKWLEAKGTGAEQIAKIKKEMGIVNVDFSNGSQKPVVAADKKLRQEITAKKNAIEMLDSDQMLEILIHNADNDGVSDNTMRLLLEYTGETAPEVLDRPRVITVISKRASTLKKLANSLGKPWADVEKNPALSHLKILKSQK